MKQSRARIWEIDLLRGIAVVGMVIFHTYYFLDYLDIRSTNLVEGNWDIFGDFIRNTFFGIVGISLVLSWQRHEIKSVYYKKQYIRAFSLLFLGLIFTFFSYLIIPSQVVIFGVLSFLGLSIILLLPFIARWWGVFYFMFFVMVLHSQYGAILMGESLWNYILIFSPGYYSRSADYFPLIPWILAVCSGAILAHFLFASGERRYFFIQDVPQIFAPVVWIGRNALLLYFLHLPVIGGFILLFAKM